jgi:hypothetical protein
MLISLVLTVFIRVWQIGKNYMPFESFWFKAGHFAAFLFIFSLQLAILIGFIVRKKIELKQLGITIDRNESLNLYVILIIIHAIFIIGLLSGFIWLSYIILSAPG